MIHDEARLLIGAAPAEVGPALAEHLAQCPDCALFRDQMLRMDQDLSHLFAAPLAPRADTRVVALPIIARVKAKPVAAGFPGLLALAASLVVSVGLGLLLW